jgi:F5/8 type C domain/Sigma-70, region 4
VKPKYLNAPGVGQYAAKRTQAEVAKLLGLTPQRVSQIERVAIGKLRRFFLLGVALLCLVGCSGEPFASSPAGDAGDSPSLGGSGVVGVAGGTQLGGHPAIAGAGGVPGLLQQPDAGAGGVAVLDAGAGGELGGTPATSSEPCITSTWRASAFGSAADEGPALAVDGDVRTRWQSGEPQAPGQWFALELGGVRQLEQLELRNAPGFESDLPAGVDLVLDGKPVASTSSSAGDVLRVSFASTSASSVRLELVGSRTTWWTIYEIGGVCK